MDDVAGGGALSEVGDGPPRFARNCSAEPMGTPWERDGAR